MQLSNLVERIKRFDAYPKTLEDFRVKTYGGATVTVVSCLIMIILFISELNYYLTPEVHDELMVDVSKGERLRINIDIVFPRLTCSFLSVDAIDVSGDQHINIVRNMYKKRLNLDGTQIDNPEKDESVGSNTVKKAKEEFIKAIQTKQNKTENLPKNRCESCYGAESLIRKCCNTCDEVRAAYSEKGWALSDVSKIEQCKREGFVETISNYDKEGCQLYGYVEVSRVGGNFHIAPGRSGTRSHVHVHDMHPLDPTRLNITHTIRHLSFGRMLPGKMSPLDGTYQIDEEGSTMFQYYIKIVPTIYFKADGTSIETNQFAVTRHQRSTQSIMSESGLPGAFFIYEFGSMMVKYTEKSRSFMHFLTSVCAIIGGVFTVAGIVDAMLYHSIRAIKKKIELGKAS